MNYIVTSELRGDHYRDASWVDAHGWIWDWDAILQRWHGWHPRGPGSGEAWATDDEVSDYRVIQPRGPFRKLAPRPT